MNPIHRHKGSKMRTIRLGDNAFIEGEEVFLPVDVDSESKSLQKQGTSDGKENFPNPDATHPAGIEHQITQKISQTAEQTQERLRQHFVRFHNRLLPIVRTWDATALRNQILQIPIGLESALNDMFHRFQAESAIRGPQWQHAHEDFNNFRTENNLIRPADYASFWSVILWGLGLILVEAALNATLLWELTGFLLAFGQTVLITTVNVVFGAGMMSFGLRCWNHVDLKVRLKALVCIPVIIAVLGFNVGVGHYRDALVEAKAWADQQLVTPDWDEESAGSVELGFSDYTQRAMESITHSFFGIDSILSVLLIIVGIGFFGVATYKWYSMWDPYPGYRKRDMVLKKAHKNYENLVSTTRGQMERKIDDAIGRVQDEGTKVTNMRTQYTELIARADQLQISYAHWCVVLEQAQNTVLQSYRDENRRNRSEPAPEYFNREESIEDAFTAPPDFNPPVLGDTDAVVEAVRLATESITRISGQIWAIFNEHADMQHQIDDAVFEPL